MDETTESNSQFSDARTHILTNDLVDDLAIQKFGCACMGCRQAALSLLSK